MKKTNCLSEQELTLHYYGELSSHYERMQHFASCSLCVKRFTDLSNDLNQLPILISESDHTAGTRMAARVSEQLNSRRSSWRPALSATLATTLMSLVAFMTWSPQTTPQQADQVTTAPVMTITFDEEMPDIEFFEELELLKELDLLSQIEGV